MAPSRVLQLDPKDNVLVALNDLQKGEQIDFSGRTFILRTDVSAKHKFVTDDIAPGGAVVMYGVLIGKATEAIGTGEKVTTRNTHHEAAAFHEKTEEYRWSPPDISCWREKTFLGYVRDDGQVGTRNYWLVVPLFFCENRDISVLKQAFEEELVFAPPHIHRQQVAELVRAYQEGGSAEIESSGAARGRAQSQRARIFEKLDGIKFLLHEGGCGGTREDSNNLCGLIAGYIHHPNVAGATVLSLGCQHAQMRILRDQINKRNPNFIKPLIMLEQQQSNSEFAMLSEAIRQTFLGLMEANQCVRTPTPLSSLCLGLKCGGSDGFSGISANPAIGHTADLVAAMGGRMILSEFPELCGVEQELINRSVRKDV